MSLDETLSSVGACAGAVRARAVSAREIAEATLARLRQEDPRLQAFTYVDEAIVRRQADALDAAIRRKSDVGPLAGVCVGVKDLIDVAEMPTSYGGPAYKPYVPTADATCVRCLRGAGAIIIGKTRTAEYAWSVDTPPTINPRNSELIPGGSSGGSGASVAAGMVLAALGTDTAGSVRIPAACCGITAIKPTYGLVSRSGVLPTNRSLDHVGPLAMHSRDLRFLLAAMVGFDSSDPASIDSDRAGSVRARLIRRSRDDLRGVRLGVVDEPLFEICEPRARLEFDRVTSALARAGAEILRIQLPECKYVGPALLAIDLPEGAMLHTERLRASPESFSPAVRTMLQFAHLVPGTLYARGQAGRRAIAHRVAEEFTRHQLTAFLVPALSIPPINRADVDSYLTRQDGSLEPALWSFVRVCWLASLTGQPAAVVPTTLTPAPFGVQIIGRPLEDDVVIDVAERIEELFPLSVAH